MYKNCAEGRVDETGELRKFVESVGLSMGTYADADVFDKIIMLFFKYNIAILLELSLDDAKLSRHKRLLVLAVSSSQLRWMNEESNECYAEQPIRVHVLLLACCSFSVSWTNAFYALFRNKMVLPAPILRPPLFSPAFPKAINYAALGGIIGHKITHAFDLQGRLIDAKGRLVNWWSNSSRKQYGDRVDCLRRSHGAMD
ncbi:hypothetical protein V5799_003790, partial [Amblyomma americanum]